MNRFTESITTNAVFNLKNLDYVVKLIITKLSKFQN